MSLDSELDKWREQWQAEGQVPVGLRKKVEQESRRMWLAVCLDVCVTVVVGGGVIAWALQSHRPAVTALAAWAWLVLGIAWLFRWRNDDGNWTGKAPDTEAFLQLTVRRGRASLRTLAFSCILYAAQLVFCLSWVYRDLTRHTTMSIRSFLTMGPVIIVWIITGALAGWAMWYRRRKKAELDRMTELESTFAQCRPELPSLTPPRKRERFSDILEEFWSFSSRFESLGWRLRRPKRLRKPL
jgi:hypothetical protein